MKRVYVISAVLVMANVMLWVGVGGAVVGDSVQSSEVGTDTVQVSSERITGVISNNSVDLFVDAPNSNVSVAVGDNTSNEVAMENKGITSGVEDSASVGFCVVGLNSAQSPIDPSVNSDNNSYSVGLNTTTEDTPSPAHDSLSSSMDCAG